MRFQSLYKKLNKEQKDAVSTIEGPVMIIAGPGTGKTLTLTMRIANILKKTDTDPQSILALTFTESGVKAMRERLGEIIGPSSYYVNINTFHSFCTDIIKEFSEEFLITEDTTPLSELERIQLFKQIIDTTELDILKPLNVPYFYINSLIKAIQDLKREGISPVELENLIDDERMRVDKSEKKINPRTGKPCVKYIQELKNVQKQEELLKIYRIYQDQMSKIKRFDFEDMINLVVDKLKNDENLKLTLQERFLYILVDEYQDTNSSQNNIIRLLTDHWENPNIFAVGDDEQSIYRFQGASLENVLYFKNLFKNAKVITLTSSYRSSQCILDASRTLIDKNLLKLEGIEKKLKSRAKQFNSPIKIARFSTAESENQFIAMEIKELLNNGSDPDQIAILVRQNKDFEDIQDALARSSIRYEITGGRDILEDGDILRLILLLKVLRDLKEKPGEDIDLFTLLNFDFLNLNKLDVLKLARFASEKRVNLLDAIIDHDIFNEINLENPGKLIQLGEDLNKWQGLSTNKIFVEFFEILLHESGFLNWVLRDKYNISRINTINTFFSKIKELNYMDHTLDLASFLENLELMKENNIKIEEQTFENDSDAVKLLTAHKAKGLEFNHVFITKCIDKKWGNNVTREHIKLPKEILESEDRQKEKNEDERRLFYVALTRAKKQVYITYSEKYQSGGFSREAVPSMFITEIDRQFVKQIATTEFEKALKDKIGEQLKLPSSNKSVLKEEDFLQSIIANMKLSVTALNNYLKCPYKFKLNNILRTPRAKPVYLSFGTAIHKALENYFKEFKKQKKAPQKTLLIQEYAKALKKELLTKEDYSTLLTRGQKVLDEYYKNNMNSFKEPLYNEYSFGFRKVYLNNIPLSGKVDKIEWVDKDRKHVKVIDYKTGSPKSKGEIEGKTKTSDGDLFRQILFYKLLSSLDRNFNYEVVTGEFDFVESKGGRKAKKETYNYSIDEIEDLKDIVRSNMEKIRNLEFERTKEYRHCQNCDFRNHCWPDGIPTRGVS
ncbi:ATP-dependent helicase [Candidatus Dojkabacteria bacterium]|nr:ATP-dependent helicase [Candidatus Dojkabacteria bacterium]